MHTTSFSWPFSNFSNFLWCHPIWDGKLSLCSEFQYPNSFGRWKYMRRVHFSILNCTAFSWTFSNFSKFLRCHPMWDGKLSLCFKFQYPNSFGRWKCLRRVHFSILNCTRRLFLGRLQTFPISYDVMECGMVNWAYVLNFSILSHLEGVNICLVCNLVHKNAHDANIFTFQMS